MKILVVDDDREIRELVTLILADQGYRNVTVAGSCAEALRLIEHQTVPFGCFLLDIHMPESDGIELCALIRNTSLYARAPIIMLTATREKASVDRAFAAGASDYATKPFEITQLCSRIRLAELIIEGHRRGKALLIPAVSAERDGAMDSDGALVDAFETSGLGGIVPAFAFENYLRQLTRSGVSTVEVYVVRLRRWKLLVDLLPSSDLLRILEHVAGAIADELRQNSCLMTYAGDSTLICYATAGETSAPGNLENRIETAIGKGSVDIGNEAPQGLEIAGDVIAMPFLADTGGTGFVVARAMEQAKTLLRNKEWQSTRSHLRLVSK